MPHTSFSETRCARTGICTFAFLHSRRVFSRLLKHSLHSGLNPHGTPGRLPNCSRVRHRSHWLHQYLVPRRGLNFAWLCFAIKASRR